MTPYFEAFIRGFLPAFIGAILFGFVSIVFGRRK